MFDMCFKNILKSFCSFKAKTCINFWESITLKKYPLALIAWKTDQKKSIRSRLFISVDTELRATEKKVLNSTFSLCPPVFYKKVAYDIKLWFITGSFSLTERKQYVIFPHIAMIHFTCFVSECHIHLTICLVPRWNSQTIWHVLVTVKIHKQQSVFHQLCSTFLPDME